MKMRAAIFAEPKKPLVLDEIELDPPAAGEALVRLIATGVCHTDLYTMSGLDPSALMPAILGHEGGGVVEAVGPGVTSVAVGDHVIPLYIPECGKCAHCLSDETNLCLAIRGTQAQGVMPNGTSRLHWHDKMVHHYMGTSTFAQYTVVPEIALAKIRKDAPLDKVCLIGCGVTTGVGAALWTAKVKENSTCAVFGCGFVGLNAIQGCRLAGAKRIIAVDLSQGRLQSAKDFGATDVVNAGDGNPTQAVLDLTGGAGVDYSFEATGNTTVMRQAFESCRMGGGRCTIIGVASAGAELSLVPRFLITGRHLTGTAFGGAKSRTRVPQLVDWYMEGKLKVDDLVSRTMALEQINTAFEYMERAEGVRSIVKF
jgi:S-(hydroxymethyl)glutathione dehydrogenase / alcohol dehydrogenase